MNKKTKKIPFHLNRQERQILRTDGYSTSDIAEIIQVAGKIIITIPSEKHTATISHKQARDLLGTERFLSGIAWSTFNWAATRECPDGTRIRFDASRIYED